MKKKRGLQLPQRSKLKKPTKKCLILMNNNTRQMMMTEWKLTKVANNPKLNSKSLLQRRANRHLFLLGKRVRQLLAQRERRGQMQWSTISQRKRRRKIKRL
jgi:hypothetical protein